MWGPDQSAAVTPLKGDASSRRFWRIILRSNDGQVPSSAIAIDLGPDDLPLYARKLNLVGEPLSEPPWLNLHRFLVSIGSAVPAIYEADTFARMLLVEDVGTLPLFEAALRGDAADLYRLAADAVLVLHVEGTRRIDDDCLARRIAYDYRLFRWELEQFVEVALAEIAPGANTGAIRHELDVLAERLDRYPRVLSHRDFHGNNLFVQVNERGEPQLRIIDFQDALMAPAAQDLAVLLTTRDTSQFITPRIERRVLDYYYAALLRIDAPRLSFDDFEASYRLCVLQHALKVIGRFTVLEREGKSGYRRYIPFALEQARRMLAESSDFSLLRDALCH